MRESSYKMPSVATALTISSDGYLLHNTLRSRIFVGTSQVNQYWVSNSRIVYQDNMKHLFVWTVTGGQVGFSCQHTVDECQFMPSTSARLIFGLYGDGQVTVYSYAVDGLVSQQVQLVASMQQQSGDVLDSCIQQQVNPDVMLRLCRQELYEQELTPAQWKSLLRTAYLEGDFVVVDQLLRDLSAKGIPCYQYPKTEDKMLRNGQVLENYELFKEAEAAYLESEEPKEALQLWVRQKQFQQAVRLAERLQLDSKDIQLLHAQHEENEGNYKVALQEYVKLNEAAGCARALIRLGEIQKAIPYLKTANNPDTYNQCAILLQELKQYQQAASLFIQAQNYDQAGEMYVKLKNFVKLSGIIEHIKEPRVCVAYGQEMESQGYFDEAEAYYQRAGANTQLCQLYVSKLGMVDQACSIAEQDSTCCQVMADFFDSIEDHKNAVYYLYKVGDGYLDYALTHNQVGYLCDLIQPKDVQQLAQTFEQRGELFGAGRLWSKIDKQKGFKLLLSSGTSDEAMEAAVQIALMDDSCTAILNKHLEQAHPKHRVKLFAKSNQDSCHNYAVKGVRKLCQDGQLKEARNLAFYGLTLLHDPLEKPLYLIFVFLQRYMMIRQQVKLENHQNAALLLMKCLENLDWLDAKSSVSLQTTAVLECYKAGYKKYAHNAAVLLCQDVNYQLTDEKFKRKIEQIVRHDEEADSSPIHSVKCQHCGYDNPVMELICSACQKTQLICTVTGQILRQPIVQCQDCAQYALQAEMDKYEKAFQQCPICEKEQPIYNQVDVQDWSQLPKMSQVESSATSQDFNSPFSTVKIEKS